MLLTAIPMEEAPWVTHPHPKGLLFDGRDQPSTISQNQEKQSVR
jgi:hypothetical protein